MQPEKTLSRCWTVMLYGIAGLVLATPAATRNRAVDFYATVGAVREVPVGNPLPGLHLDAKVNGRATDIYIAPMDFVARYEVSFSAGEEVHVIGSQTGSGETDTVLAREITAGVYNRKTLYLRNDDGPFRVETAAMKSPAAHS